MSEECKHKNTFMIPIARGFVIQCTDCDAIVEQKEYTIEDIDE